MRGPAYWHKEDDGIAKHAHIEERKPRVAGTGEHCDEKRTPETTKDKQPEAEPPLVEEWDLGGDTTPNPRLAGGTHGEAFATSPNPIKEPQIPG
jgi:hypothetical protein